MNLLAHALLAAHSFADCPDQTLSGALMADYFGGQELAAYPPAVQQGIRHHRAVDDFTDHHGAFGECRRLLAQGGAPRFSAGILVDLFWDYFLGSAWDVHGRPLCGLGLAAFVDRCNAALERARDSESPLFGRVRPWLVQQRWLEAYASPAGIAQAIEGLALRLPHGRSLSGSHQLLERHRDALRAGFEAFWPELVRQAPAWTAAEPHPRTRLTKEHA